MAPGHPDSDPGRRLPRLSLLAGLRPSLRPPLSPSHFEGSQPLSWPRCAELPRVSPCRARRPEGIVRGEPLLTERLPGEAPRRPRATQRRQPSAARAGRGTPETIAARLRPKTMIAKQTAIVNTFAHYICSIKPRANDVAGLAQRVEVKSSRARARFEAQHLEEAAAFRENAMQCRRARADSSMPGRHAWRMQATSGACAASRATSSRRASRAVAPRGAGSRGSVHHGRT